MTLGFLERLQRLDLVHVRPFDATFETDPPMVIVACRGLARALEVAEAVTSAKTFSEATLQNAVWVDAASVLAPKGPVGITLLPSWNVRAATDRGTFVTCRIAAGSLVRLAELLDGYETSLIEAQPAIRVDPSALVDEHTIVGTTMVVK